MQLHPHHRLRYLTEGSIRLILNLLGCQSLAHAGSCGPPFWFISWGSSSSVGLTWLSPSRGLCLQWYCCPKAMHGMEAHAHHFLASRQSRFPLIHSVICGLTAQYRQMARLVPAVCETIGHIAVNNKMWGGGWRKVGTQSQRRYQCSPLCAWAPSNPFLLTHLLVYFKMTSPPPPRIHPKRLMVM
jgi:hypothetical protein